MRLAVAALLLAGCNDLLGFGDPTLAVPDPSTPSCDNGWTYRVPITITNASGSDLSDYQVKLVVDTHALIAAGKLAADGADLQLATGSGAGPLASTIERGLDTATTVVWIDVPDLPAGTSTLELYYGNPAAHAVTVSPFVQDIVANPSFEDIGGWEIQHPPSAHSDFGKSNAWASDGAASMYLNIEVDGTRTDVTELSVAQPAAFPEGTDYVLRFDVDVIAASNTGSNSSDDGSFYVSLGDSVAYIWRLSALTNITGFYLDEESRPFGAGSVPLAVGATVNDGTGPAYAKGYFDHLRVRKYVSPEPTAQLGREALACAP